MFVRVIHKSSPVVYSLLNLSICLSRESPPELPAISVPFLATLYKMFPKIVRLRMKNTSDWIILENRIFENFILADEPFTKALQGLEAFVLVNNSLCGKLVLALESPITYLIKYLKLKLNI